MWILRLLMMLVLIGFEKKEGRLKNGDDDLVLSFKD
jgi:hypothetical protein